MFLLWLGCVVQLFILKCSCLLDEFEKNLKKEEMAEMTLQHSIELMHNLNDNYAYTATYIDMIFNRTLLRRAKSRVTKERSVLNANELKTVMENIIELRDADAPAPSPKTINRSDASTKIPIMLIMKNLMRGNKLGYCYAAMIGMIDIIIDKEDQDLKTLIDAFGTTIIRMSDKGKFKSFDDFIEIRIKFLKFWTFLMPAETAHAYAYKAKLVFENKARWDNEIDKIITVCDTLFTENEGEKLLVNVAKLYEYNDISQRGPATVQPLIENIIDALIAPVNRKRNSFEVNGLSLMINKAYMERYPNFRRSEIDDMIYTITTYERNVTTEKDRPPRINDTQKKPVFNDILRHLITKHPTFFKKLVNHRNKTSMNVRCTDLNVTWADYDHDDGL